MGAAFYIVMRTRLLPRLRARHTFYETPFLPKSFGVYFLSRLTDKFQLKITFKKIYIHYVFILTEKNLIKILQ
jgi:hypothetical protein